MFWYTQAWEDSFRDCLGVEMGTMFTALWASKTVFLRATSHSWVKGPLVIVLQACHHERQAENNVQLLLITRKKTSYGNYGLQQCTSKECLLIHKDSAKKWPCAWVMLFAPDQIIQSCKWYTFLFKNKEMLGKDMEKGKCEDFWHTPVHFTIMILRGAIPWVHEACQPWAEAQTHCSTSASHHPWGSTFVFTLECQRIWGLGLVDGRV